MFLLRDLKLVRLLGEGSFGKVFLVAFEGLASVKMKKLYALKVISKARVISNNLTSHIYNEKMTMLAVHSPFCVRLYSTFQDEKHLFLVMEYVPGGDLFFYMKEIVKFSIKRTRFYIAEILVALEGLHTLGIIYRDLKPENILLDEKGHIKLADFGSSKQLYEPITWTLCGTPEYMAPELVMNRGHGFEVDFWSLGIVLYEMIVGRPPFYHASQVELCRLILLGHIKFPASVNPVTRDLIKKLLQTDRKKRLGYKKGAKMIRNHPFFHDINWGIIQGRSYKPPIVPKSNEEDLLKNAPMCSIRSHILETTSGSPVSDHIFDQY
ncbi:protein kinase X [Nematocida minor]|uniref:protein kinase X n=1 Tax=Nematocida minor TaxID=1912983 RepID=UPI00222102D3|nr:protein kinase X [Nematocida minor]KAI5188985.1 protein kinase X [Nematocida minor]